MPRKAFNGGTVATRLNGPINNATTTITVLDGSTYPSGPTPFVIAVSRGSGTEEKVLCSSRTGNVITASTRGFDGTVAQSHGDGALVEHVLDALTVDEANEFANTMTSKGDLITRSASAVTRLAAGTNGHALVADSAATEGIKWAAVGDVTLSGTQTLTNKTLTSPTIDTPTVNGGTVDEIVMISPEERWTVSATAATGTVNVDVKTTSVFYYTSAASANWTFNFRGNSITTLSSMLNVGDSVTVTFAVTQGATAYYPTTFQVDGSAVTPKWQGGTAPTSGNANSIDAYVLAIVKTAATPTYTVFASQVRFA